MNSQRSVVQDSKVLIGGLGGSKFNIPLNLYEFSGTQTIKVSIYRNSITQSLFNNWCSQTAISFFPTYKNEDATFQSSGFIPIFPKSIPASRSGTRNYPLGRWNWNAQFKPAPFIPKQTERFGR